MPQAFYINANMWHSRHVRRNMPNEFGVYRSLTLMVYITLPAGVRCGVLSEVNIQIEISWVETPCNLVGVYQRFGGTLCFHL
jgi:hypothetical protein